MVRTCSDSLISSSIPTNMLFSDILAKNKYVRLKCLKILWNFCLNLSVNSALKTVCTLQMIIHVCYGFILNLNFPPFLDILQYFTFLNWEFRKEIYSRTALFSHLLLTWEHPFEIFHVQWVDIQQGASEKIFYKLGQLNAIPKIIGPRKVQTTALGLCSGNVMKTASYPFIKEEDLVYFYK